MAFYITSPLHGVIPEGALISHDLRGQVGCHKHSKSFDESYRMSTHISLKT